MERDEGVGEGLGRPGRRGTRREKRLSKERRKNADLLLPQRHAQAPSWREKKLRVQPGAGP